LNILVVVELVARSGLERQANAGELEALGPLRLLRRVREIGEFRRIAGVQVRIDPRNRPVLSFIAQRAVVPQTISLDRSADAACVVPLLEEFSGNGEAGDLLIVVADHAAAHTGQINLA